MKRFLFFILAFVCIFAVAASAEEKFLDFEFSHSAADGKASSDVIECVVNWKNVSDPGLSSVELVIEHSDGLRFGGDCKVTGLADGWALWDPNVKENSVKIALVDDTAVTAGFSDMTLTFTFIVEGEDFSSEYIKLSENYISDFDLNDVTELSRVSILDGSFVVNMPKISLENLGASLRINNTPALRFGVRAQEVGEGIEIGIIYSESAVLTGELTHSSPSAMNVVRLNSLGDGVYTTGAVKLSSNTQKYTFRPYAKLKLVDGSDYYVYFETLERSGETVARAVLETETNEEKRAILESFCSDT